MRGKPNPSRWRRALNLLKKVQPDWDTYMPQEIFRKGYEAGRDQQVEDTPDHYHFEGNKGGDYIKITPIDDNRFRLELASCCVVFCDEVLTTETLTGTLTALVLAKNKGSIIDVAEEVMPWSKEVNEEFMKGCKKMSWMEETPS